jgi:hypothetical protein
MMPTPDMVSTTGSTTIATITKPQLTPLQLTPPRLTLRTSRPSRKPRLVNSKRIDMLCVLNRACFQSLLHHGKSLLSSSSTFLQLCF